MVHRYPLDFDLFSMTALSGESVLVPAPTKTLGLYTDSDRTILATVYLTSTGTDTLANPLVPSTEGNIQGYLLPNRRYYWKIIGTSLLGELDASVAGNYAIDATAYGFSTANTAAQNKTALDAVMVAAAINADKVILPAGTFNTNGGVLVPSNVIVEGAGGSATILNHMDNTVLFTNLTSDIFARRGFKNMKIVGNAGAAAVGIELGNCYFPVFENLHIQDYTAGVGIDIHNSIIWTEGITMLQVHTRECLIGFRFRKSGTGTNSLAELRMLSCNAVTDIANCIGLLFDDVYVYGGVLNVKFNNTIATGTLVELRNAALIQYMHCAMFAETSTAGTRLRLAGSLGLHCNGSFDAPGMVDVNVNGVGVAFGGGNPGNEFPATEWTLGQGTWGIKTATKTVSADGDVTLCWHGDTLDALVRIQFDGPNRSHHMTIKVTSAQFANNPSIAVLDEWYFNGQRVFGEPFIKRHTGGTAPHLIIPVANRAAGTALLAEVTTQRTYLNKLNVLPAADFGTLGAAEFGTTIWLSSDLRGLYLGSGRDASFARAAAGITKANRLAGTVSAAAEVIATSGTITFTTGIDTYRLNPAGNVTAVVMPAGTVDGEEVVLVNESAFTITFDVVGTSRVRDGAGTVIIANRGIRLKWVAATTTWTTISI